MLRPVDPDRIPVKERSGTTNPMTWKTLKYKIAITLLTLVALAMTVGADWIENGQGGGF